VKIQKSLRRHMLLGLSAVAALAFITFGWGTLTEISGAVIAPGKMVSTATSRRCSTRPVAWSATSGSRTVIA